MKIFEKAKVHFQSNLPFVLYAKPNDNQLNAYFQHDDILHEFENQSGFVFVSFDGAKRVILPENKSVYFSEEIALDINIDVKVVEIQTSNQEKNQFENLVTNSVKEIKTGAFEKLVVSRKIDFSTEINLFKTYQKLIGTYKSAFRYLFFHPKIGIWIGATPEQLLKIESNQFETVALAGTQLYSEDIIWTSKEIQEQQFVTDFIVSNCEKLVSAIEVTKPFTVQAGKLAHIKTIIKGRIDNDLTSELISKLHPTPAVCGLPKEKAKTFILHNENYDRKFYAGFIGEWSINDTTNLFVNLRCMEIGKVNSIYVGCGITKDSIAENEFIETENKAKTMQNILVFSVQ